MATCVICNNEVSKNYCDNCGQPTNLKRINGHYLLHEVEHVLHFERGILYTIRELLLRPGTNIKRFLRLDRSRLVKPVIFLIVTSLVYTIVTHLFHIAGIADKSIQHGSTTEKIMIWTESYIGYSNIIMGGLIALFVKLLFRNNDYNFFEILILLCFVMGFAMLIFTLFVLIEGLTHIDLNLPGSIISVIYCSWAIGHFFAPTKVQSYLKALLAYILGTTSYYALSVLIGNMIDSIIK